MEIWNLCWMLVFFLHEGKCLISVDTYKIWEKALTTDDNLYVLEKLLYPYKPNLDNIPVTEIYICQEDLVIRNISELLPDDIFEFNESVDGYVKKSALLCDPSPTDTPCTGYFEQFNLYSKEKSNFLHLYIQDLSNTLQTIDPTGFTMLAFFTGIYFENHSLYIHEDMTYRPQNISLVIGDLQESPSNSEYIDILSSLLSWAKYYVQSNMSSCATKLDSEKMFVDYLCGNKTKYFEDTISSFISHDVMLMIVAYLSNFLIMCIGLYIIYTPLKDTDIVQRLLTSNLMFWLRTFDNPKAWIATIPYVIINYNIIFFLLELTVFTWNDVSFSKRTLPVMLFFAIIEVCVIIYITFKVRTFSAKLKSFLYAFVMCHNLWFAHRLFNCFLISLYFLSVAPARTVAAITLCASIAILTGIYSKNVIEAFCGVFQLWKSFKSVLIFDSYQLHQNPLYTWIRLCTTSILAAIFLTTVIVLIFFTLIFVDLIQHGLSASTLGSFLLASAIPIIVLIASAMIKKASEPVSTSGEASSIAQEGNLITQQGASTIQQNYSTIPGD